MGLSESLILSLIVHYSSIYQVDPVMATAVARVESNLNPMAVSPKGAIGVFQIMPINSKHPERLYELDYNINNGIRLIAQAKKKCKHQIDLQYLTCYNHGIKGATRLKTPSTSEYVKKVKEQIEKIEKGDL